MNRVGYILVALLFTGCFAKKESLPELKERHMACDGGNSGKGITI